MRLTPDELDKLIADINAIYPFISVACYGRDFKAFLASFSYEDRALVSKFSFGLDKLLSLSGRHSDYKRLITGSFDQRAWRAFLQVEVNADIASHLHDHLAELSACAKAWMRKDLKPAKGKFFTPIPVSLFLAPSAGKAAEARPSPYACHEETCEEYKKVRKAAAAPAMTAAPALTPAEAAVSLTSSPPAAGAGRPATTPASAETLVIAGDEAVSLDVRSVRKLSLATAASDVDPVAALGIFKPIAVRPGDAANTAATASKTAQPPTPLSVTPVLVRSG